MRTDCTASTRKNTPRSRRRVQSGEVRAQPGVNVRKKHVMIAMFVDVGDDLLRIDCPVTRRNDPHLYAMPLEVEPGNYVVRMLQGGAKHHVIPGRESNAVAIALMPSERFLTIATSPSCPPISTANFGRVAST